MRLIQAFAIRRPIATAMFYGAVVIMGLISFSELQVNLLPELEFPRLTVITVFPDAAPEEVESLVTRPISESVRTASGVQKVFSESIEGVSFITLQFGWDTDTDFAAMEVREKVDLVRGVMPQEAERSIISRFDPAEEPFMEIAVFARGLGKPRELRDFVHHNLKGYLDRVDGVALVSLSGGFKKEIQIDVDQARMLAHGLSLVDLSRQISTTNLNSPAGSITAGDKDILIRTVGEYTDTDDVGRTVVGSNQGGVPVLLRNLAEIKSGYSERTGLARYNGKECVLIGLKRESGRNIVNSAELAREEIARLQLRFDRELELRIIYDQSEFISQSIDNLVGELVFGGLLAFCALVLILRNLRSPLILLTVLPVSLLATFILLFLQDISLNMMSLGGLALGVGMLFDSGNIVLTAIERHSMTGLPPRESALRGAGEVSTSVISAVLTTVIVFLPVVFLKSVIGVVFAEMALTITFSLLVSMVCSLTLIPMLASLDFLRGPRYDLQRFRLIRAAAQAERTMELAYARNLGRALENPARLFRWMGALFVCAWIVFYFVPREFVPHVDTGEFQVEVEAARGSTIETTTELVGALEERIATFPDVRHVIARVGYDRDEISDRQGGDVGTHSARLRVILTADRGESAREAIRSLRGRVRSGDDSIIRFEPGGDVLGKLLSPEARSVALDITGEDLEVLRDAGQELSERLGQVPGLVDVGSSMTRQGREYHFFPDGVRSGVYGLSNEFLANYLKKAIDGEIITQLRVADEEIDVRLRGRGTDRDSLRALDRMQLRTDQGRTLFLAQTGRIEEQRGHTSILREGPVRVNRVTADVQGSSRGVNERIESVLENLKLPDGYSVRFAGERENIEKSFRELLFAFALAALLIYMLLAAQFESFKYSLAMMATIPLIAIGIFPALLLTGKSLNVSSFTGLILLVGIVVDSAALFYEYVHLLREEGLPLRSAIQDAGRIVLRPVLMNSGTTVLGLLPVALEIGQGTEFQSPMAITVISGLVTALFLSLLMIPTLFFVIMKREQIGSAH